MGIFSLKVFVVLLFAFGTFSEIFAAACCAGGSSFPSLVTSDDRWNARLSFDTSFVVADTDDRGNVAFYDDSTHQIEGGFTPSLAYVFFDQWQAGFKLPILYRQVGEESSHSVGDLELTTAYEAFPMIQYHSWRPKLYFIGGLKLPTANSTYETRNPRLESFGSGFVTPSLGVLGIRTFQTWDAFLFLNAAYQFDRNFEAENVSPGMKANALVGGGYSLQDWRLGLSLGPSWEEEKELKRAGVKSPDKLIWDTSFELSYRYSDPLAFQISYLDQTLLGPARNVELRRSLSLSISLRQIR